MWGCSSDCAMYLKTLFSWFLWFSRAQAVCRNFPCGMIGTHKHVCAGERKRVQSCKHVKQPYLLMHVVPQKQLVLLPVPLARQEEEPLPPPSSPPSSAPFPPSCRPSCPPSSPHPHPSCAPCPFVLLSLSFVPGPVGGDKLLRFRKPSHVHPPTHPP